MYSPFLIFSFLSLPAYILLKILFAKKLNNNLLIATVLTAVAIFYGLFFRSNEISYDFHLLATILSIITIVITIYESIRLESHIINLKQGIASKTKTTLPIESEYKYLLKLLGIGLVILSVAILSGFVIYEVLDLKLALKITFSSIAIIIYGIVYLAMLYAKLTAKQSLRLLLIALLLVLTAYFVNIILINNFS
tara:strand:- start:4825 stop:5406 length:582 start_codon:yes stop_codon:yes gene_type:complete